MFRLASVCALAFVSAAPVSAAIASKRPTRLIVPSSDLAVLPAGSTRQAPARIWRAERATRREEKVHLEALAALSEHATFARVLACRTDATAVQRHRRGV